jgi:hypothetical protein
MRRFSFKNLLALGAAVTAAGTLPSCAQNDSMIYIVGVAVRKQGACTLKPEFDGTLLSGGAMDVQFASEYVAGVIIGNQLTARGSRERLRTETSKVALKGAEVRIETSDGATLIEPFSTIGTGFVNQAEGADASPAGMFVTIIPSSVAKQLAGRLSADRRILTVVTKTRVFGTTLGGEEVESAELLFPIDICNGCLVTYPASARDLTADGSDYQCKLATEEMATVNENEDLPCKIGIDFPTPCTSCSALYEACTSPAANPYYQ